MMITIMQLLELAGIYLRGGQTCYNSGQDRMQQLTDRIQANFEAGASTALGEDI